MKILMTGVAGFIGMHTAQRLRMRHGWDVVGIDCMRDGPTALKQWRLNQLDSIPFYDVDVRDRKGLDQVFQQHNPDIVLHLAAKAGVRQSLAQAEEYLSVNGLGFANVIALAQQYDVERFVYASSSSVYGGNESIPSRETDRVESPLSLYAVTKRENELLAKVYTENYGVPTVGLRFFTVYGPAGRPDMAVWKFTRQILNGETVSMYNHGKMWRDFVYVDDVVEGIYQAITARNIPLYFLVNVSSNNSVQIPTVVDLLGQYVHKPVTKMGTEAQVGDPIWTQGSLTEAGSWLGYEPTIDIETGVQRFVDWYQAYQNEVGHGDG